MLVQRLSSTLFRRRRTPSPRRALTILHTGSVGAGGKFGPGFGYAILTGASLLLLRSDHKKTKTPKNSNSHQIPKPEDPFVHPLQLEHWTKRYYMFFTRYVYMILLWTPVSCLFILSSITQSEYIYRLALSCLEKTITYAGCGFQKFAQWLSMRPDRFHPDLVEVGAKFREHSPSHTFEESKRAFEKSVGKDLEDVFEYFDPEPLASGTVAQVHRAKLREEYASSNLTTREVAVKVRHDWCYEQGFTDVNIMLNFLQMSYIVLKAVLPFDESDFSSTMQRQIDFLRESYNLLEFSDNFKDDDNITFPRPYPELCSDRIIVEQFCHGQPVSPMMEAFDTHVYDEYHESSGVKDTEYCPVYKAKVAANIFDLGMKMYLRDNFAHADLHSGNLLANEDGSIVVLDTGIVTSIDSSDNGQFMEFLEAGIRENVEDFTDLLLYFNTQSKSVNRQELQTEVRRLMDVHLKGDVGCWGGFYGNLLGSINEFDIELRGDVATSVVNMGVMEGMIRSLDPTFDIGKRAIPYLMRRKMELHSNRTADTNLDLYSNRFLHEAAI